MRDSILDFDIFKHNFHFINMVWLKYIKGFYIQEFTANLDNYSRTSEF